MPNIEIKKEWLSRARDRAVLTPEDRERLGKFIRSQTKMHTLDVSLADYPEALWTALLDDARLPPKVRTAIALHVFGMRQGDLDLDAIYDTVVENPVEFGTTFQMAPSRAPNCEILLNDRWYPVNLSVKFVEGEEKWTRMVQLNCLLSLGERAFGVNYPVSRDMFLDHTGDAAPRTVIDVLQSFGLRRLQSSAREFNLRLVNAERTAAEHGRVVMVTGSVIVPSGYLWWRGFETRALGTPEMPTRGVIEPVLEVDEDERGYYYGYMQDGESQSRLPFVRVFSLETKSYVYADVDDVEPYEFETDALSRLHLPPDMHSILSRVFNTPIEQMFGDLLKGKHGGVVVLASGEPGVGKTLTAEIYAEITERPLYVLELGELGTTPSEVEERLQRIFARVTRWNAVLQFDECEIFLAERGTDLNRSAIVGIFLRLLDYYRGLLFLTTNRPQVLDGAVLSRVMLRLEYPHLEATTRAKVWRTMFSVAGLRLEGCSFEKLAELDLNGRQIRNLTRLAKILCPERTITPGAVAEVLKFGCGALLPE